jgi:ribosome-associated protein
MSDTKPRKTDVQKLQRAIVDGLEDVKGQDIVVFNTEHLSPLFERVIIASGTSNRQTKALASSISDAVREAGFPKPRVEGEENGEWIIVDCGAAVAHVMQPSIRQYYHLEEIWGGKTVNLKQTAPAKPAAAESTKAAPAKGSKVAKAAADAPVKAKRASKAAEADAEVTTKPKAKATAAKTTSKTTSRSTAKDAVEAPLAKSAGKPAARLASKTVGKAAPVKTAAPKSAPAKTAARKTTAAAAPAAKVKTLVVGKPAVKKVAAKAPARKVATRKKAG